MDTKKKDTDNFVYMRPANERQPYNVTSSLIDWAHEQNDPWKDDENSCECICYRKDGETYIKILIFMIITW